MMNDELSVKVSKNWSSCVKSGMFFSLHDLITLVISHCGDGCQCCEAVAPIVNVVVGGTSSEPQLYQSHKTL